MHKQKSGVLSDEETQKLAKMEKGVKILSILSLIFFPILYFVFPIQALIFVNSSQEKKIERVKNGKIFGCSFKTYFITIQVFASLNIIIPPYILFTCIYML